MGSSERLPCELAFIFTSWSWKKKQICVSLETIHKGYHRQINLAPWRQHNSFEWKGDSPQRHREKSPFILFLAEMWKTRRSSSCNMGNAIIIADTTLARDVQAAPRPIPFLTIGFRGHLGFVIPFPKYTIGTTPTLLSPHNMKTGDAVEWPQQENFSLSWELGPRALHNSC